MCPRNLFKLIEHAAHILWVQEKNGIAMRADLRLAVTQNSNAFFDEIVARRDNVRHFEAKMVRAAARISLEKSGNRLIFAERIKKLDLGIFSLNKNHRHPVLR